MRTMLILCSLCLPAWGQEPASTPPATEVAEGKAEKAEKAEGKVEKVEKAEGKADEAKTEKKAEGKADEAKTEKKAEGKADEAKTKAPTTDAEAVQTAVSMIEAFKAGQVPFGVGLLLTLLVYVANRFGLSKVVSPKMLPVVAFATGMVGAVGTGLVTGVPVSDAILTGVLAGVAAIGGWEVVAKVFGTSEETKPTA